MTVVFLTVVFFLWGQTAALPITSAPPRKCNLGVGDADLVLDYLHKFGYLKTRNNSSDKDCSNALIKLQKMGGLQPTGKVDKETRELMKRPRCQFIGDLDQRRKRFATMGAFPTKNLTYSILNYPSKSVDLQKHGDVDAIIARALSAWSNVSSLRFKRVSTTSHITLKFAAKDHGDGFPFDGPSGVLAHAFGPQSGQVHFDDDEAWTKNSTNYNLLWVTAHETGHALGLAHTNVTGALMYPWYPYLNYINMAKDDIDGIRSLYGP